MEHFRVLYYREKYSQLIHEVEEWLSDSSNGINDELISLYTESLIKKGKFDEAYTNIEFLRKYYPDYIFCHGVDLVDRYAKCKRVDKVKELLSQGVEMSRFDYLKLANILYFNNEIEYARELFMMIDMNNMFSEDMKEYHIVKKSISLIDNFLLYAKTNPEQISKQTYASYLYSGRTLRPGLVVYLWNSEKFKNISDNDKKVKKYVRPYMIWKIDNDKIYAFALTTKLDERQYTFYSYKYAFQHPDRRLKDKLVCLREYEISNVEEIISYDDFNNAIDRMYFSIVFHNHGPILEPYRYFVDSVSQEVIERHKIKTKEKD